MKKRLKKTPDRSSDDALRRRCERGLSLRFGGRIRVRHKERLAYELSVIAKLGYADRFLKLASIAAYIRRKGIRMGPGRGAAPSSLVCWSLGVTHVAPVFHELLFERFLNLGTKSFPVVEMDVSPADRERILGYLKNTWGPGCVALVGCSGRRQGPTGEEIIRGVHASAVCVSESPLEGRVASRREGPYIVTEDAEEALQAKGLFVFGLVPLRALEILPSNFSVEDYEDIAGGVDRTDFFERLANGRTAGIYQLDSPGIQTLIKRVRPERLDHVVALLALYRPGPLRSGLVDLYVKRRHQKRPILYHNLSLMDILYKTYGLILYQEQVMSIAERIAVFTPEMADELRKAIGRKNPVELKVWRRKFRAGCRGNRTSRESSGNAISKEFTENLFDMLENFGAYASMRSHSLAAALLACRTGVRGVRKPWKMMRMTYPAA